MQSIRSVCENILQSVSHSDLDVFVKLDLGCGRKLIFSLQSSERWLEIANSEYGNLKNIFQGKTNHVSNIC